MDLFGWLLKNELRLWWRETTGGKHFWAWVGVIVIVVLCMLASLWFGLSVLRAQTDQVVLPGAMLWGAIGLWLVGFLTAFSQAVSESIVVLFERGDLDLLLSSPVSSRAIFAVRLLSVALNIFLSFCLLVVPVSVVVAFAGFPELLGVYPALIGLCLVAASLGMLVTLQVVRWVGARRAKSLVQAIGLILTAVMLLGSQAPNFLLTSGVDFNEVWVRLRAWTAPGSLFSTGSWIWFPARAMLSDPLSVALTLGVSGAIATATVYVLESTFIRGTQQSVTRKRQVSAYKEAPLKDGFNRVVLAKEWRTMRRQPYLISQVALQVVCILPMTWFLLQGGEDNPLFSVGSLANVMMPILGGQLACVFTSVCLSGEESADLLKSSPVSGARLRRLKQLAALIPIWLLLLPAIAVLIVQGYPWLSAVVATLGATIGASFLRLWRSRPVPLGDLFRQRKLQKSDLFLMCLEIVSPWLWMGLGAALQAGSGPFVFLAMVGLVVLFSLGYWRGRQLGTFFYY